jgi:hypothetical protein
MQSKHWEISEKDLADMLQANHISIAAGSMFECMTSIKSDNDRPRFSKTFESELIRAIKWVSQPYLEIGLLASPSSSGEILRFFRGSQADSDALVGHRSDDAGNHVFACTSEQELISQISKCLMLDIPTESGNIQLDLDAIRYQALLSIIDWNREIALKSLLERKPLPERIMSAGELLASYNRSSSSDDFRWLAAIGKAVSPIEATIDLDGLNESLRKLTDSGLLEVRTEGWVLSPRMEIVCAALGSPIAYCILYRRYHVGHQQWVRQHLMALRGMGTLWLFQFKGLDSNNPIVHIRDASCEDMELVLAEQISTWGIPKAESIIVDKEESKITIGIQQSGASRPAQQDFEPLAMSDGQKIMQCSKCHAQIRPGTKFCGSCGIRLRKDNPLDEQETGF